MFLIWLTYLARISTFQLALIYKMSVLYFVCAHSIKSSSISLDNIHIFKILPLATFANVRDVHWIVSVGYFECNLSKTYWTIYNERRTSRKRRKKRKGIKQKWEKQRKRTGGQRRGKLKDTGYFSFRHFLMLSLNGSPSPKNYPLSTASLQGLGPTASTLGFWPIEHLQVTTTWVITKIRRGRRSWKRTWWLWWGLWREFKGKLRVHMIIFHCIDAWN